MFRIGSIFDKHNYKSLGKYCSSVVELAVMPNLLPFHPLRHEVSQGQIHPHAQPITSIKSATKRSFSQRLKKLLAPLATSEVEVVMVKFRLDIFAIRLVRTADTGEDFFRKRSFQLF